MRTVDERIVRAPVARIFGLARAVERWPALLPHYRYVRFRERTADGGGIVEMSANRPFAGGRINWPTRWVSRMEIQWTGEKGIDRPAVRFRHIEGITTGMDVAWTFLPRKDGVIRVRIVHTWDGPRWPLIGSVAANVVIGPVFIHGIAARTLEGLATLAEGDSGTWPTAEYSTDPGSVRGAPA